MEVPHVSPLTRAFWAAFGLSAALVLGACGSEPVEIGSSASGAGAGSGAGQVATTEPVPAPATATPELPDAATPAPEATATPEPAAETEPPAETEDTDPPQPTTTPEPPAETEDADPPQPTTTPEPPAETETEDTATEDTETADAETEEAPPPASDPEPAVEDPESVRPIPVPGGDDQPIAPDPGDEPDLTAGWTRMQPRNDLSAEQSSMAEDVVVGPGGSTLLVRFWGGVEPCFGARVEVTEGADLIEVQLITGLPPGAEVTTCIALAVAYEIEVPLSSPVGQRQILAVVSVPAPGTPISPPDSGAVFETTQYLGLSQAEAEALAVVEQRALRVARIDDEFAFLTQDAIESRVNIEIEAGIVVDAYGG